MTRKTERPDGDDSREARLAEALRANLARRKAQVRARAARSAPDERQRAGGNDSGAESGES